MNKIFKVIFNRATQTWIVVSEMARGRLKSNSGAKVHFAPRLKISALALALAFALGSSFTAHANNYSAGGAARIAVDNNITLYDIGTPDYPDADRRTDVIQAKPWAVAIGSGANITKSSGGVAIGHNASADIASVALGQLAKTKKRHSIAIGPAALTNGENSLAMMRQAYAGGDYAISVGTAASVTGKAGIGLGKSVRVTGQGAIAIGSEKDSSHQNYKDTNNTRATGNYAIALGTDARATANNALALGLSSRAKHENGIALGAESETGDQAPNPVELGYSFKDHVGQGQDSKATGEAKAELSIGSATLQRRIIHVAAGSVTENSTDAVNGSQLYDVVTNVGFNIQNDAGTSVARVNNNSMVRFVNGNLTNAVVENKGNHVSVKFDARTGNLTVSNNVASGNPNELATTQTVADALNRVGFKLQVDGANEKAVVAGSTVNVVSGKNIAVSKAGDNLTIATVDTPTFTSLTTTDGATIGGALTAQSATFGATGGAGGIQIGNGKISGLQAGSGVGEAVEYNQFKTLSDAVDQLKNRPTGPATGNLLFEGDTGGEVTRALGEKLRIIGGANTATLATASNIGVEKDGQDGLRIKLAEQINLGDNGSLTTGKTVVDTSGLLNKDGDNSIKIGGGKIRFTDETGRNSKDNTPLITGSGIGINNGQDQFRQDKALLNNEGIGFSNGNGGLKTDAPKLTKDGIDAGGRTISNVGAGNVAQDSKDAATAGQLHNTAQSLATLLGGAQVNNNGEVTKTGGIGGTGANSFSEAIQKVNEKVGDGNRKFIGDTGGELSRKMTETLTIKGGATDLSTHANIGVINENNELKIRLAKQIDLGTDGGLTIGNSKLDNTGLLVKNGNEAIKIGDGKIRFTDQNGTSRADMPLITNQGFGINNGNDQFKDGAGTLNQHGVGLSNGNGGFKDGTAALTNQGIGFANGTNGGLKTDAPKLTATGIDAGNRIISNVGAGNVAANSKDAATAGQLHNTAQSLATLLGGAQVNNNGEVTKNGTGGIGGTGANTFAEAIEKVNEKVGDGNRKFEGDTGGELSRTMGQTLAIKGGATGNLATANNIGVEKVGEELKIRLAEHINLGNNGKLTTGNSELGNGGLTIKDTNNNKGLKLTSDGMQFTDGAGQIAPNTAAVLREQIGFSNGNGGLQDNAPKLTATGINAGGHKVSNIADGTVGDNSKEAITGKQLHEATQSLATLLGGGATANNGQVTLPGTAGAGGIGGTGANSFSEAIQKVNEKVGEGNRKFTGDDGQEVSVTLANSLNIKGGANAGANGNNIYVSKDPAGGLKLQLAQDLTGLRNITTTGNVTVGGDVAATGTVTGASASFGNIGAGTGGANNLIQINQGGNGKITGLTDGTVSDNSKEAITGKQLHEATQSLATLLGGGVTANGGVLTVAGAGGIGGTGANNFADAIKNVNDKFNSLNGLVGAQRKIGADDPIGAPLTQALGEQFNIKGGNTANGGGKNITTAITGGDTVEIKLAQQINLGAAGSVTTGNSVLDNSGLLTKSGDNSIKIGDGKIRFTDVTGANSKDNTPLITGSGIGINNGQDQFKADKATLNNQGFGFSDGNGGFKDGTAAVTNQGIGFSDGTAGGFKTDAPKLTTDGIDAGGKKVSNIADGEVNSISNEAISGKQLHGTADSLAKLLGGNATVNDKGQVTLPGAGGAAGANGIGGTGQNTVIGAIDQLKQQLDQTGATKRKLGGNTGEFTQALGDKFFIKGEEGQGTPDTAANNIVTQANGDTLIIQLKKDINLTPNGTLLIGDSKLENGALLLKNDARNQGLKLTEDSIRFTAANGAGNQQNTMLFNREGIGFNDGNGRFADNAPKLTTAGIDAGQKKVSNLADGEVSANSNEAISGKQLHGTATSLATALGSEFEVKPDGSVGLKTGTTTIGGTKANTVSGAIKEVKDEVAGLATQFTGTKRKIGADDPNGAPLTQGLTDQFNIKGVETVAGQATSKNITTSIVGNDTVAIKLAEQIDLGINGGLTIGNSKLDNTGLLAKSGDETIKIGEGKIRFTDANGTTSQEGTPLLTKNGIGLNDGKDGFKQGAATLNSQGVGLSDGKGGLKEGTVALTDKGFGFANGAGGLQADKAAITDVGFGFSDGNGGLKDGAPKLSATGIDAGGKKISNVGTGNIAQGSTDAATAGQLHGTAESLSQLLLGQNGGTVNAATGQVSLANPAAGIGGTGKTNFAEAISTLNTRLNSGFNLTTSANAGGKVSGNTAPHAIRAGTTLTLDAGRNIEITQNAGTVAIAVTDNPIFDTVSAQTFSADDGQGNRAVLSAAGTTVSDAAGNQAQYQAGGIRFLGSAGAQTDVSASGIIIDSNSGAGQAVSLTSAGLDNGGNRLRNIAVGVAPNDAVTKGQLDAINSGMSSEISRVDSRISGTRSEVLGVIGVSSRNGRPDLSGLKTYNPANHSTRQHQNLVSTLTAMNEDGIKFFHTNQTGNTYVLGNTIDSSAGAFASTAIGIKAKVRPHANGSIAIGMNSEVEQGREQSIALGANAKVSRQEIDPANTTQMRFKPLPYQETPYVPVGSTVEELSGYGKSVVGEVSVGRDAEWAPNLLPDGTVDSTQPQVLMAQQTRRLSNVAAGSRPTDAANVSQVASVANRLQNVAERTQGGIAAAMAAANLPQASAGKSMIAAGVAAYRGQAAIAVGGSLVSNDGKWVLRGSANLNKHDAGVALGVGYQW